VNGLIRVIQELHFPAKCSGNHRLKNVKKTTDKVETSEIYVINHEILWGKAYFLIFFYNVFRPLLLLDPGCSQFSLLLISSNILA